MHAWLAQNLKIQLICQWNENLEVYSGIGVPHKFFSLTIVMNMNLEGDEIIYMSKH